ncbi:MAG TPA: hypothetical protein VFF65_04275, partial [Phycisphaerales bacterium]|nr:hypothetical protein [Phycisphaerales bacterium]
AATAPAEPAKATTGYTRVAEKEDGTLTLEIASRTFVHAGGKPGPAIHLVGAVHIGDKPYYSALQTLLDAADLVLFEGVKPPGAGTFDASLDEAGKIKATTARLKFLLSVLEEDRSRTGKLPASLQQAVDDAGKRWKTVIASSLTDAWGRPIAYSVAEVDGGEAGKSGERAVVISHGPNGADDGGLGDDVKVEGKAAAKKPKEKDAGLQAKMADALGLSFQLEEIDSSRPNWRSSDMSVDQLQAKFEEAGVDGDQLFKMLDGSSFMGKMASLALGFIKSNPRLAASVKVMMVDMLGSEDAVSMGPAEMKKMMGVILKDRNDVVLQDLRAVLAAEQRKDIAIFYGAGHLPDMEEKLVRDFGYTRQSEKWMEAISVRPADAGMTREEAKSMREVMKKQLERQVQQEKARAERAEKAKQLKREKDEAAKKEVKKDTPPAPAEK